MQVSCFGQPKILASLKVIHHYVSHNLHKTLQRFSNPVEVFQVGAKITDVNDLSATLSSFSL